MPPVNKQQQKGDGWAISFLFISLYVLHRLYRFFHRDTPFSS